MSNIFQLSIFQPGSPFFHIGTFRSLLRFLTKALFDTDQSSLFFLIHYKCCIKGNENGHQCSQIKRSWIPTFFNYPYFNLVLLCHTGRPRHPYTAKGVGVLRKIKKHRSHSIEWFAVQLLCPYNASFLIPVIKELVLILRCWQGWFFKPQYVGDERT